MNAECSRLYKAYLSNPAWINDLRRADAIFFAAHSQGCIVTTHLTSRLIAQGHIRTRLNHEAVSRCEWAFGPIGLLPPDEPKRGRKVSPTQNTGGRCQKIAMLAMCGVHLGPIHSISTSTVIQPYLQWFENAAARELFEFGETNSAVSVAYQKALAMVLENQVKVMLLASKHDQVASVPPSQIAFSFPSKSFFFHVQMSFPLTAITPFTIVGKAKTDGLGPDIRRIIHQSHPSITAPSTICRWCFVSRQRLYDKFVDVCVYAEECWGG